MRQVGGLRAHLEAMDADGQFVDSLPRAREAAARTVD
jgi:hypothetical protein